MTLVFFRYPYIYYILLHLIDERQSEPGTRDDEGK